MLEGDEQLVQSLEALHHYMALIPVNAIDLGPRIGCATKNWAVALVVLRSGHAFYDTHCRGCALFPRRRAVVDLSIEM